jgi:microcystin-dependent protein
MDPYIGQIQDFGFNFPPRGWALCDGSILPIAQNTALFSLLGTTFGGNGTTNFALPDLRGRIPVGQGQGPGLQLYEMGDTFGMENETLSVQEMPIHNHVLRATNDGAATTAPANNSLGAGEIYNASPTGFSSPAALAPAGSSQPHPNLQPTLVTNWCIALQGVFPPRQ